MPDRLTPTDSATALDSAAAAVPDATSASVPASAPRRPTLSVVCITNDPGAQVRAVLEPLRGVADEIVVAADDRVADADLRGYLAVADRVILYAFAPPVERPYAWAHAQCTGDWVLRIDGDELLSPELIARLPELIARPDRVQYWLPRRWSFPDAAHWLAERPWAPDPQLRLVRNDPALLAFPGLMHTAAVPVAPSEVVEEPFYHADLLLKGVEERTRKADGYEELRPGLVAPGGVPMTGYYLPERWADRPPEPVPAHHAEGIARLTKARGQAPVDGPTPDRSALRRATREEIDAHWDGRPVGDDHHAATIAVLEPDVRFAPGETGDIMIRVTNDGAVRWPGGDLREPLVRLGVRWREPAADLGLPEPRTAFTASVEPGRSIVARLNVVAPPEPGTYVLVADVVHEGRRWFGVDHEITVEVTERLPKPEAPEKTGLLSRLRRKR